MGTGLTLMGLFWSMLMIVHLLMPRGTVQASMLTELKVCVQRDMHTLIDLVCPDDYLVIIANAAYRRSQQPGCHPTMLDSCLASDVSTQLTMPCFFRLGTCKVKVMATNIPQCERDAGPGAGDGGDSTSRWFRGEPYFHVLYKCEPMMLSNNPLSQTVDMCTDAEVSGSLVYLWNTNFPQYTTCSTCRCVVHVAARETHVQITLPHFKTHGQVPTDNDCSEVIHFWSGSNVRSICSEVDDSFEPLQLNVDSTLYIEFDNRLMKLAQFWITLGVHHSKTMSVQCGPSLVFPPRPMGRAILPPQTTRGPTTAPWHAWANTHHGRFRGENRGSFSSGYPGDIFAPTEKAFLSRQHVHTLGYIPIIAAILGATLVIVLIIMIVVFGCKKRRKPRGQVPPLPTTPDPNGDFSFDNDIYMTDNARRGRNSNQSPPPPPAPDPPPIVIDQRHQAAHDVTIQNKIDGSGGGGPKKFLALEAPKSTVVPNPYAGIPADSPKRTADSAVLQGKKVSVEYEDLSDFDQTLIQDMLNKQTGEAATSESKGFAETKLEVP